MVLDHGKLLLNVRLFPQIWDRNCVQFRLRDKSLKDEAWERIGFAMNGTSADVCKDAFKSLREKYVREREKQVMFGEKYLPWQHLDAMSFLDAHIVLRKTNPNYGQPKSDNFPNKRSELSNSSEIGTTAMTFDRNLIILVQKATPIWDRRSNGYPSKQLKDQLWKSISHTLTKDVATCMNRWKGLREKYIRQKTKYQEGEGKWEFLDDMSFLDSVIQYRRKSMDEGGGNQFWSSEGNSYQDPTEYDETSSFSDLAVKTETSSNYDSSYDSGMGTSYHRKRSASDNSSEVSTKTPRIDESPTPLPLNPTIKGPEQLFGELVTSWLSRKNEREKNAAMIAILQILTK